MTRRLQAFFLNGISSEIKRVNSNIHKKLKENKERILQAVTTPTGDDGVNKGNDNLSQFQVNFGANGFNIGAAITSGNTLSQISSEDINKVSSNGLPMERNAMVIRICVLVIVLLQMFM